MRIESGTRGSFAPSETASTMGEEKLTLSVAEVARHLGIGRKLAYELAAEDKLPVPVLRLGRRILIPREPFLRALGVTQEEIPDDTAG